MSSNHNPQNLNDLPEESETDNTLSIDEFFKQLEAKEKDLEISSDLVIEVDESDIDGQDISDFLQMDLSAAPNKPEPIKAASPDNPLREPINSELQKEILNLQTHINRLENERFELVKLSRRRQNDFENYKSRIERERRETFRDQLSNLAIQMLPVVDNLTRALDSTAHRQEEYSRDIQQFFEGINLVSQQLNEILVEMGIQPIPACGEPFDPHYHEAVATEITDEVPAQTITTELLRGYRIGDKVIRPSMVKVAVSATNGNLPQLTPTAE